MYYEFRQNNSGGVFTKPAISLIIEADNMDEANYLAERHGIYFNGCDDGRDCSCCGDRWSPQWRDDGTEVPSIYEVPIVDGKLPDPGWSKDLYRVKGVPYALIIHKDGTEETYNL